MHSEKQYNTCYVNMQIESNNVVLAVCLSCHSGDYLYISFIKFLSEVAFRDSEFIYCRE